MTPTAPKPKCDFCGKPEEITRVNLPPYAPTYGADGMPESLVWTPDRHVNRTNLVTIARGLTACRECAKVHEQGKHGRGRTYARA